MRLLEYLFYRLYMFFKYLWGEEDKDADIKAAGTIAMLITIDIITLLSILSLFFPVIKEYILKIFEFSKFQLFLYWLPFYMFFQIIFKAKKIEEKYKDETEEEKRRGKWKLRIFVICSLIGWIISLFILF